MSTPWVGSHGVLRVPRPKPRRSFGQNVPLLSPACGILPFLLRRIRILAHVVTVGMCLSFPQVGCSSGGPPTRPANPPCTQRPCRTSVAGESGAWLVGMWPRLLGSGTSVPFLGLVDTPERAPLPLRGSSVSPPHSLLQGIRHSRTQEGRYCLGQEGLVGPGTGCGLSSCLCRKKGVLTVSVLQRLGGLCSSSRLK